MLKKILVGICGIGNGHINRQLNIVTELLKRECEIIIATTYDKKFFLESRFPNIKKIYINIPWIACNKFGVDYDVCLEKYKENDIDQFENFLNFCKKIEQEFHGKPDLIISDYEPNVAQYSYIVNKPLICMEQQSKFLYLKEKKIYNCSINEEIYRLNYFFPKFNYRIISSFFPIRPKEKNVFVLPPIIESLNPKKKITKKGIIYFSPYCSDKNLFKNILEMVKNIQDIQFIIYTNLDFKEYSDASNLLFNTFNDDFKNDLSDAYFIISSSGHQLISECICSEIPMYLFTLGTYEQNYNCLMVEEYRLGKKITDFSQADFYNFYNAIPTYIENIKMYKKEFWKDTWDKKFNKILDNIIVEEKL